MCLDPLRSERLPQTVDVHLERLRGRPGWGAAPELVDEPLSRDDLARAQEQDGEERTLFRRPERDGTVIADGFDRPEQAEFPAH